MSGLLRPDASLPSRSLSRTGSLRRTEVSTPKGEASSRPDVGAKLGEIAFATVKDVLNSVDGIPFLQTVAELSKQILDTSQQVKMNKESCQRLGQEVQKMVVALANAQEGKIEAGMDAKLEKDLGDFKQTLEDILDFTHQMSNSKFLSRVFRKEADNEEVKRLEHKLENSFRIFVMVSSVSLRQSQQSMALRLDHAVQMLTTVPPVYSSRPPTPTPPIIVRIPEGIYEIRNVASGNALELGFDLNTQVTTVHCLPSQNGRSKRQLWALSYKRNTRQEYWIRNLASGKALDLDLNRVEISGTPADCYPLHGGSNQTWRLQRSEATNNFTIQNCAAGLMLDVDCPQVFKCSAVHCCDRFDSSKDTSQEWSLILWSSGVFSAESGQSSNLQSEGPASATFSNAHLMYNKLTKCYATLHRNTEGRNVFAEAECSSLDAAWRFIYLGMGYEGHEYFAITSYRYGTTLDHCGQSYINSSRTDLANTHHMWEMIPRDRSVLIRNVASGQLLCHNQGTLEVDTADASRYNDTACHWCIYEADGGSSELSVVYDVLLSFPSPSLLSDSIQSLDPPSLSEPCVTVAMPDAAVEGNFRATIEPEQTMTAELLQSGYNSFVLGPKGIDVGRGDTCRRITSIGIAERVGTSPNLGRHCRK